MFYRRDETENLICKDCLYRKFDGFFPWGEPFEGYRFSSCTKYIRKPSDIWEWDRDCYYYRKQQPNEQLIWKNGSQGEIYFAELELEEDKIIKELRKDKDLSG